MPKKTIKKENLSYVMESSQSEMHLKSNVRRNKLTLAAQTSTLIVATVLEVLLKWAQ